MYTCSIYATLNIILFQKAMEAKAGSDDTNAAHLYSCPKGWTPRTHLQATGMHHSVKGLHYRWSGCGL